MATRLRTRRFTLFSRTRLAAASSLTIAALALSACGLAQGSGGTGTDSNPQKAVADFYRGKTVRIVVGFPPGASYDTLARLVQRHLGKHIPGKPTVIVENVPGAGGMVSVNNLYNVLPKDGTVIGSTIGTATANQLLGNPDAKYDASQLQILGAPSSITYVLGVSKKSGITSLDQVLGPNAGQSIKLAMGAPGEPVTIAGTLFRDVLGAKVELVGGYTGAAASDLAIEQGEVAGKWSSLDGFQTSGKLESGDIVLLAQWTDSPQEGLTVPTILTMAKSEPDQELLRYAITVPNRFARSFVVAPDVPADRVAALRDAFTKAMADPELLKEAETANIAISPVGYAELEKLVDDFLGVPQEIKSRLSAIQ